MAKTFTTREFTKRGFERREDLDFRDDGTAYKGFSFRGLNIIYTKSFNTYTAEDRYYIAIRVNLNDFNLNYTDVSEQPWYALRNNFNGVSLEEIDMDQLIANIDAINKGIEETVADIKSRKIDAKGIQDFINVEIQQAENALQFFRVNYDWYNSSNLSWDIQRAKRFEEDIKRAKELKVSEMSQKALRDLDCRIQKHLYAIYELRTDDIYAMTKKNMVQF